ncbi:MAG: primase, partial [Actinomycetota bacterium]|nr:primase [Actinomycetota bacterium]
MAYDRNEVLERTDLRELADQLAGPHKGRGAGATWPCPDPGHGNQTGRTPPVSIFRTAYGDERWRCHSCGAGGTAIDLVMTTQAVRFPEALELLAQRAGVAAAERPMPRLRSAHIERPESMPPARPNPEVERFVAAAEAHLWSEQGRPMQRWLAGRGLGEDVLRANRVGADPGPAGLERARGLPRGGAAIVLPVLDADGLATYLQARYLHPKG